MKPTLIFLHLPKAAGTTLKSIIRRQYDPDNTFVVDDVVIDAYGETGWKSIPARVRWERARSTFDALPESKKWEINAVMGHMWFGWHEITPRPCVYVTILREPIERTISHYRYIRRMPDHPLSERIRKEGVSLHDFVEMRLARRFENVQTKFLTGDFDPDEKAVDKALSNLDAYFSVAGTLSTFDVDLLRIADKMGWSSLPVYQRRNTAPSQTRVNEVDPATLSLIEEHNALDLRVFDHIQRRSKASSGDVSSFEKLRFQLSRTVKVR